MSEQRRFAARMAAVASRLEKVADATASDAMSQFQFRQRLQDWQADRWYRLVEIARKAVADDTATQTQRDQWRAWNDFNLPPGVEIDAPETQGGIFALWAWGVLGDVWNGEGTPTATEQAALDDMNLMAAGLATVGAEPE